MSNLNSWINPEIIEQLNDLSNEYIKNSPYPHISIPNFLQEEKAETLKEALLQIEFQEFDTDLYHFFKSLDFKHIKELPKILQEFHSFIFSKDTKEFFQTLTTQKLNKEKIGDLHSILCQHTHYLLCHDDQVDERIIAFIVNLSEDFEKEDGGSLDLFDEENNKPKQIVKQITPKFNQLNVFTVSEISFHQISEVESENKNRISISGWYYK